jgi:hypothetical protein
LTVNVEDRLNHLLSAAEGLGLEVRREAIGGGGGLCTLRGRQVLFVDLAADVQTAYESTVAALCDMEQLETIHLPPAVREDLEQARAERET